MIKIFSNSFRSSSALLSRAWSSFSIFRILGRFGVLFLFLFPFVTNADVIISEVAWMGSAANANAEWIELENTGTESVSLTGWKLEATDGTPNITLSGSIPAKGFFLLERTSDDSVPGITKDLIFSGALGNTGEVFVIKNGSGQEVHRLEANPWPAGSNETKKTMQWNGSQWITAAGTPKALNALINEGATGSSSGTATSTGTSTATSTIPIVDIPSSHSGQEGISEKTVKQISLVKMRDRLVSEDGEIEFEAQALDENGKKIYEAEYSWSYGDGTLDKDKKVSHSYRHSGKYVVVVTAEEGAQKATGRFIVNVVQYDVRISERTEEYIELENMSPYEVNIEGWKIKSLEKKFEFPKDTIILPTSKIRFDNEITGIAETSIEIISPSGTVKKEEVEVLATTTIISTEEIQTEEVATETPHEVTTHAATPKTPNVSKTKIIEQVPKKTAEDILPAETKEIVEPVAQISAVSVSLPTKRSFFQTLKLFFFGRR